MLTDKGIAEYSRVEYPPGETTLEGFQDLRERIRKSQGGGPGRNTLIVYLSMHGAVDKDGQACLIPPGVSPLDSQKWLPLHQVLRYLFPEDDRDRLKHKLVILDCNRMDANWGLGLLYNGFADDLDAARKRADVPGLVILNSTSPGQIGWTAPEEGFDGSVFGYYVRLGLLGAADRGGEGNDDTQVSLQELHRYVAKCVSRWAQESRADAQVPMLVPADAGDFPLVYSLPEKEIAEYDHLRLAKWSPTSFTGDSRWNDVATLWAKHAELENAGPWRTNPLGWEQFQHGLLHLEQLLVAGGAYRVEFDKSLTKLTDLAEQLGDDPAAAKVRAYSLPLATGRTDLKSVPQIAGPAVPAGAGIDAEADQLRAVWAKTPGKFTVEAGRPASYLVVATAAWRWCLEHPEDPRPS